MTGSLKWRWPLGIALGTFLALNANGREIPSYDSQPARLLAREIVLRHTLTLDEPIRRQPLLAGRQAFGRDVDGHWRSRVSVIAALPAAALAWVLAGTGLVDLEAPLAPSLVAKLTASMLVSLAAVCAWIAACRWTSRERAALIALGFALGTGLWPTAGQTLWQHATAIAALMGAVALLAQSAPCGLARGAAVGALVGVAIGARLPVAPLGLAVLCAAGIALGPRRAWVLIAAIPPIALAAGLEARWFGVLYGGATALEQLHGKIHGVDGSFGARPWEGLAGLLVSPSRGLLIYSPVTLVAIAGVASAWRAGVRDVRFWSGVGAAMQLAAYSTYSVWWGGHTYGPRYALDLLPALVPLAASGIEWVLDRPVWRWLAAAALAWSLAVSATGAFCHPSGRWNNHPGDIDTHHRRLWQWRDPQILRCWQAGLSPQNFALFSREAVAPQP